MVGVFGEAAGGPVVFKLPEVFVFAVDPRDEEDEAGTINELIVAFPTSEARQALKVACPAGLSR